MRPQPASHLLAQRKAYSTDCEPTHQLGPGDTLCVQCFVPATREHVTVCLTASQVSGAVGRRAMFYLMQGISVIQSQ